MSISIKLVATDMDGTLLDSEKRKPEEFVPWVKQHPEIKTVIASGRQYFTLRRDFEEIADELVYIAENGALVFENGEIIYCNEMAKNDLRACLELVKDMPNVTPILCGAKSAYMEHADEEVEQQAHIYYEHLEFAENLYECIEQDVIVKVAFYVNDFGAEAMMPFFANPGERISSVLSGVSWIDIANTTVNKGVAIHAIQEKLGIAKDECMAFGDYLNDYELLLECTESYVMANGHPKLKAIAKYETASNDENGVMKVLSNL